MHSKAFLYLKKLIFVWSTGLYFVLVACSNSSPKIQSVRLNSLSSATFQVNLIGLPKTVSNSNSLNVTVIDKLETGDEVPFYQYKVGPAGSTDCADKTNYSSDISTANPITSPSLSPFPDGDLILCVIGKNASGKYQSLTSPTIYQWTKDTTPPGTFLISGVIGTNDSRVDAFLTSDGNPIIQWQVSSEADSYEVTLYENDGATVRCPTSSALSSSNKLEFVNCLSPLNEGSNYKVAVKAKDAAGNTTMSTNNMFSFKVNKQVSLAYSTITGTSPTIANGSNESTISITLKNASNIPIEKAVPTFSATDTGGTNIYGVCSPTNDLGISNCSLKSKKAESKVIAILTPISKTGGGIDFIADAPNKLAYLVQPSSSMAGSIINPFIKVQVLDANNNLVTSASHTISIAFQNNPGSSTLSGTLTQNAVSGVATFNNISLNKVGVGYTLIATNPGLSGSVSSSFNITPGAATQLSFSAQPITTTSGATLNPIKVQVLDAKGNLVTTANNAITLDFQNNPGSSTLSGSTTKNALGGEATFDTISLNKVGTNYSLKSTASGLTTAISANFDILVETASKLSFSLQPTNTSAGTLFTVKVQVLDPSDNLVTTASNSIALAFQNNPGSSTLIGYSAKNAVGGTATFSNLALDKVGSGYTLVASSSGLSSVVSNNFNIIAGSPNKLSFKVNPYNTSAGSIFTPALKVQILDSYGNLTNSSGTLITLSFSNNPGSSLLSGLSSQTQMSNLGESIFNNIYLDKVGSGYSLKASGASLIDATSTNFDIGPGSPSKLSFTVQPTNTTAGLYITPAFQVKVLDNYDNLITTSSDSISLSLGSNPGGSTLSGTTSVAAVAGIATFDKVALNKSALGYTLKASGSSFSTTSASFNINASNPTKLAFSAQPSDTQAGSPISTIKVAFLDNYDNLTTAGSTIQLALDSNPGGSTLSGNYSLNAVSGEASFTDLSLNKVGSGYTLRASSGLMTTITSNAFNIKPGSPTKLVYSEPPRDGIIGTALSPFVQVSIFDANDNLVTTAVNNIKLALGANPGSSTLSDGTSLSQTPVLGIATFTNVYLSKAQSGYTLIASSTGLSSAESPPFRIIPAPLNWGDRSAGQLGDGSSTGFSKTPNLTLTAYMGDLVYLSFTQVTAGDSHSCGITAIGEAYCWGQNDKGQLGNGVDGIGLKETTPVLVLGGHYFKQISAGAFHTCAIATTGGEAYCWGNNSNGQLGINNNSTMNAPTLVNTSGLSLTQISAGENHTCAITDAKQAYCWGYNFYGQLGTNESGGGADKTIPTLVVGGKYFESISAGNNHSCGIESGSNAAYCWGKNKYGQVGNGIDGSSAKEIAPALVEGGNSYKQISCGASFTCAIDTLNRAYCWGKNFSGQLGNSSTSSSNTPSSVNGTNTFYSISTGSDHTCAIDTSNTPYCWGSNLYGQLGANSSLPQIEIPTLVDKPTSWWKLSNFYMNQISAGGRHTIGISGL